MLRSRQTKSSKLGNKNDSVDGADEREHERLRWQDNRQTATANKRRFMLTLLGVLIVLAASFFGRSSLVDPSTSSSTVGSLFSRSRDAYSQPRLQEEERRGRKLLEADSTDSSDGTTFNGFPVTYRPGSPTNPDSSVHCVGENYGVDAWMYRSCQFRHLCFDLDRQELVLFPSAEEKRLLDLLSQRNDNGQVTIQSIMSPDTKIALGPMNIQNLSGQSDSTSRRHLEWFPTAVTDDDDPRPTTANGYYELPDNVVLVPFFSTTTNTQQHWLWQNLLSIFTLLSIFDLQDQQLALIDYNDHPECPPLSSPEKSSSSSDSDSSSSACHSQILSQMLVAMGVRPDQYRSKQGSTLQLKPATATRQSNFVCARTGAAGLGMIANMAPKPAQVAEEWLWTHTAGRGATLREFRNYMARHLGVSIPSAVGGSGSSSSDSGGGSGGAAPIAVTFFEQGPKEGVLDGTKAGRELESVNFQESYSQVRSVLSEQDVSVEWFHTSTLDFALQASKAAESAIFITFCGEQTIPATFLPRGASLIVYCDGGDGGEKDRKTLWSNRLDWRVLNNAAYFRTHWLPLQNIRTKEGVATLVRLVQSELDLVRQQV
jgi:hypothetical protein